MSKKYNALIHECGSGFPEVGDYVSDGSYLYIASDLNNNIHTDYPIKGNYIYAKLDISDWSDCDECEEFPCKITHI